MQKCDADDMTEQTLRIMVMDDFSFFNAFES